MDIWYLAYFFITNVIKLGEEPVPLLHQVMAALMLASKEASNQSRAPIGYMCLLCVWLFESPSSVKQFLSEGIHVQFVCVHKSGLEEGQC
jgi:hypothetical protein